MTDSEIYELGLEALFEKLGPDGTIRFLSSIGESGRRLLR